MQTVTLSTVENFTTAGSATLASSPGIQMVSGKWGQRGGIEEQQVVQEPQVYEVRPREECAGGHVPPPWGASRPPSAQCEHEPRRRERVQYDPR
jgi:hypothetical protein